MGVEYYTCNYCGETFSDCGDFVGCECGTKWCDDECAEADGYISEHCSLHPDLDNLHMAHLNGRVCGAKRPFQNAFATAGERKMQITMT